MAGPTGALTLIEEDRRVLDVWANCTERALLVFEARAPGDARPREALGGLRASSSSSAILPRATRRSR
ncbi:MAG: hypothetical protein ACYCVN_14610 [Acidimicrobiales bacterium]